MLRILRRPFAPHAALVACVIIPASVATVLGASSGCADLISPISDDSGVTSSPQPNADAGSDGAPSYDCAAETGDASFGAPNDLACTGLYGNFQTKTIASGAQAFDPGLSMWQDGATSRRWILLPAGQKIDTSDMNEWTFPVGTKTWQELTLSGQVVETRFFWKRGTDDWVRGSYAWSSDGTSAVYSPNGVENVGDGTYSIPATTACDECHAGRIDRVLGFEAVSLSTSASSGLNMAALTSAGLLTAPPSAPLTIPDDGTGLGAPALGWLHANCGTSCHSISPSAFASSTGLFLRLDVTGGSLGAYASTNAYVTAVNVTPALQPFAGEGWKRITPHDSFATDDAGLPGLSLVPYTAETRNNGAIQMPPIGSSLPDTADVDMVKNWITNGNFPQ